MNGTIADSITIRVGNAIMTIPRKINNTKKSGAPSDQKEQLKKQVQNN
jgi:hypothetical protein